MHINADFSKLAVVTPDQYRWTPSPQAGLERVMLDRIGDEIARATSIVRYAKNSTFPHHQHPEGEEILVLSGTFSEDGIDYPAGWYLRSPPGSGHCPSSNEGAIIFVKLRQMPDSEKNVVRINTNDPAHWVTQSDRNFCPLFNSSYESVVIERLTKNQMLAINSKSQHELLILSGELLNEGTVYVTGSWIRIPEGHPMHWISGVDDTMVYVKTTHSND